MFDRYFVVDPTNLGHLVPRLSDAPPASIELERSLTNEANAFYKEADALIDFGDGVQAFVGLLSIVLSGSHKILLVDEPEAFLPPPVARRLGRELTRIVNERTASLVVATHSADFLMGCIDASQHITVVRLTYDDDVARARALPPDTLAAMMRHPLVRSTGVLRALFHHGAVIAESDTDRAFYDEINQRLLPDRGISDALFINAQNWQTETVIAAPLRQMGIPAALIVDLDVLLVHGKPWSDLFDVCHVDRSLRDRLCAERDYLRRTLLAGVASTIAVTGDESAGPSASPEETEQKVAETAKKAIKERGVSVFDTGQDGAATRARATALVDELARYGLFLVVEGEVESWVRHLGISGHGSNWLVALFDRVASLEQRYTARTTADCYHESAKAHHYAPPRRKDTSCDPDQPPLDSQRPRCPGPIDDADRGQCH